MLHLWHMQNLPCLTNPWRKINILLLLNEWYVIKKSLWLNGSAFALQRSPIKILVVVFSDNARNGFFDKSWELDANQDRKYAGIPRTRLRNKIFYFCILMQQLSNPDVSKTGSFCVLHLLGSLEKLITGKKCS